MELGDVPVDLFDLFEHPGRHLHGIFTRLFVYRKANTGLAVYPNDPSHFFPGIFYGGDFF